MWEKIKKFFKWIADHTGISWIVRKISSGWKWLFGGKANATQQNRSQQEKSSGNERQEPAQAQSKGATTPKTLDDEVNSQPGASVNDSTSNSGSSSFENVGFSELPEENKEDNLGSPETSGCGDDTGETFYDFDGKLDEQSEIDGVEGKKPATSLSAPDVQAANDKTR
ncbi:hypothetical protein H9I48_03230 [Wolbachia pipientis]|uniref:hypothetical protein n=1 Tax=Wolbachia pipientis TaxID=955 RepID=UPI001651A6F8|nr:hypothetical protein [Wolbachia pipientis]MBC6686243.1 hypothetical protein [Wolbachia pipientis]